MAAQMGRKNKRKEGKENTQVPLIWSGPRQKEEEEGNIPGGGRWSERADTDQQNQLPEACVHRVCWPLTPGPFFMRKIILPAGLSMAELGGLSLPIPPFLHPAESPMLTFENGQHRQGGTKSVQLPGMCLKLACETACKHFLGHLLLL